MTVFKEAQKRNLKKLIAKKWKVNENDVTDNDIEYYKKNLYSPKNYAKSYAGMGAGVAGFNIANGARRSGALDGIARLYHNTEAKNVKNIKNEGIKSSHSLDKNNLTSNMRLSKEEMAGKTYYAKNRSIARMAGNRREQLKNSSPFYVPKFTSADLFDSYKNQKTLKVNVPLKELNKMKKVDNPELMGAKNTKEYARKMKEANVEMGTSARRGFKALGKDTTVIEGDMASKFIKGGAGYKGQTLKGIVEHVKENPKMFAKGLGKATAGIGMMGLGAKMIYDGNKAPKNPYEQKVAAAIEYLMEK